MNRISLADAKAHLSELVTRAEAGDTVEITRRGRPVARLVPIESTRQSFDIDELARVRALGRADGMSVEEMRRRDLL